jgi:membrane protease YdiL (CAAX protease family)
MNTFTDTLKRYSLPIGILLMFLLTWPIDLANAGVLPFQVPEVIAIFVGYGFVIAVLLMTGLTRGKDGLITLLKRYLIWRVGWKWYLVAFLLIPFISLVGVSLNAALTQTPLDFSTVMAHQIFGPSVNLLLIFFPFILFDAIANGEEIAWRGYVLPRLQSKYSALASALLVGLIAGFWHLPKFLSHWDTVTFAWWMGDIMAKSILLAWMYNNTKGSLLLASLFHGSFNAAGIVLPIANTQSDSNLGALIVIVLLEAIVAIVVTVMAGSAQLSRTEQKQIQE